MADNDTLSSVLELLANPEATRQRAKELMDASKSFEAAKAANSKELAEIAKAQADVNDGYKKASEERMAAKRDLADATTKRQEAQAVLDAATIKAGEVSQRENKVEIDETSLKKRLEEFASRELALTEREQNVAASDAKLSAMRVELEKKLTLLKSIAA